MKISEDIVIVIVTFALFLATALCWMFADGSKEADPIRIIQKVL